MNVYPKPELVLLSDGGSVPNNPALPVYLQRGVMAGHTATDIRAQFEKMGWAGTWTYIVFDFHHYHPNAHEALCVATGWADLQLGGAKGPMFRLEAGDLVVLPAGTGHCRLDMSADFSICGGYPPGQEEYSTFEAAPHARTRHGDAIKAVPLPATDPIFGPDGPLITAWADTLA